MPISLRRQPAGRRARPAVLADAAGLLAALPNPVIALDGAGIVRFLNPAAEQFFEWCTCDAFLTRIGIFRVRVEIIVAQELQQINEIRSWAIDRCAFLALTEVHATEQSLQVERNMLLVGDLL